MCTILDEYARNFAREDEEDMVRGLFGDNVPFLSVKKHVKYLSEEKLKEIYDEVTRNQKK